MFKVPAVDVKLHKAQAEVFRNPSRFRILVAGRRFGKTLLARAEILRAIKGRGRRLIWYVCPTFSMAREIMWDDLLANIPKSWIFKINETRLEVRLINGVKIQLKGADRPDTLRGRGVDFVILDEYQDFRPNVWKEVIYPTLTTTKGRALIIGTPRSFNHFYDKYRLGQIKKNQMKGMWWSWQFPTIMSPFFPPSEIEHARANLDRKTFAQEFEACHVGDTLVRLIDGSSKRIDEVMGYERLVHLCDDGLMTECLINACGFTGNREVIELQLETGETFSASREHRFKLEESLNVSLSIY